MPRLARILDTKSAVEEHGTPSCCDLSSRKTHLSFAFCPRVKDTNSPTSGDRIKLLLCHSDFHSTQRLPPFNENSFALELSCRLRCCRVFLRSHDREHTARAVFQSLAGAVWFSASAFFQVVSKSNAYGSTQQTKAVRFGPYVIQHTRVARPTVPVGGR